MAVEITFRGQREMRDALRDLQRRFPRGLARAMYRQAEVIMTRSKEHFVPVDLSTLKNSGHVERASADGLTLKLVYGGPAAPYAEAVHEHPSQHDPPSWRNTTVRFSVGGPGYLRIPMEEAVADGSFIREIAADIERELRRRDARGRFIRGGGA